MRLSFSLVARCVALPLLCVGCVAGCSDRDDRATTSATPAAAVTRCAREPVRTSYPCYREAIRSHLQEHGTRGVDELDRMAHDDEALEARCHGIMHEVVPGYVRQAGIDAADVADHLPRGADVHCAGGFTHALLMELFGSRPQDGGVVATCARQQGVVRTHNCFHGIGHAYLAQQGFQVAPALRACTRLRLPVRSGACANGVFHSSFSFPQQTGARMPTTAGGDRSAACGTVPSEFLHGCWFRAVTASPGTRASQASRAIAPCADEPVREREACVFARTAVTYPDPQPPTFGVHDLRLCEALAVGDQPSCMAGVLVRFTDRPAPLDECRSLGSAALRAACVEQVARWAPVFAPPVDVARVCSRLRDPALAAACDRGAGDAGRAIAFL